MNRFCDQTAPDAVDENLRLQTLRDYQILDTPPERSFDDLTALGAELLKTSTALVSLVDEHRQWFKSRFGLDAVETAREVSFCAHAIQHEDVFVVPDARLDERFAGNPLVTDDPFIRFYAGMPITAPNGARLGTFCVIDSIPRSLDSAGKDSLRRLARLAEELLALRMEGMAGRFRQQQLERQQAMNECLLGSLVEAVVVCDAEGKLTLFNDTAREWHGADIRDMDPASLAAQYDLFEADGITPLPMQSLPLLRALQGESVRGAEICIAAGGQPPRFVLANGGPLRDSEGQLMGAVVVMHDISERKRIELMKRNFLASISHELRTPLTSISGAINLLLGGASGELPETASKMLVIAQTNATRLSLLVNDLLDIEKLESGHMRLHLSPQLLLPLVRTAIESNLGYASDFSVKLELQADAVDAMVLADGVRVAQIMDNYLSNAAKFSHPGGTAYVSTELLDGHIHVSVHDTGAGIDPADHPLLFQKFSQLDTSLSRKRGGTGLGLAIVKQLVERMGGNVGLRSEPGEGAVFWFSLPLYSE